MPLHITIQGINKTIAFPFNAESTVAQVIEGALKRASLAGVNGTECILKLEDTELFAEDKLSDLSISDNSKLSLSLPQQTPSSIPAAVVVNPPAPVVATKTEEDATQQIPEDLLIRQLDVVVLDVSGSMRGSAYNTGEKDEMTRIEAAQTFFQTYIDKLFSYEILIAVGLVCFGEKVEETFPISRMYDKFSTELGNVDANQSATRLYDAIILAAKMLTSFRDDPKNKNILVPAEQLSLRIFCLTDGSDNWRTSPFDAYSALKSGNIILDSMSIGKDVDGQRKLSVLTSATGGSCFGVGSIDEGLALFEREAVLSLEKRNDLKPFERDIPTAAALQQIKPSSDLIVTSVQKKVDKKLETKTVVATQESLNNISQAGTGTIRRIIKELGEFASKCTVGEVFASADDVTYWKIALKGPAGSPYADRYWLLSCSFPNDYPFKPPAIRFQTPIYHCNVNREGGICLDILKDHWSPACSIATVVLSINSLLNDPDLSNPLDTTKAALLRDNKEEYFANAKAYSVGHAFESIKELKEAFKIE